MKEMLEAIVATQRLVVVVALALFLAAISIHHPDPTFKNAKADLQSLEDAIAAASDQVDGNYKSIYDKSELKASTLAWLMAQHSPQQKLDIRVFPAPEFAIPDAERNPLVTIEAQVNWADRVYRNLEGAYFLCAVGRLQVFRALHKLFGGTHSPEITRVMVHMRNEKGTSEGSPYECDVSLEYEISIGDVSGTRIAPLALATTAVQVTRVVPWTELEVAATLKEHGLGDYESSYGLNIPSIRKLWTELAGRPPDAAFAYLDQKQQEEDEKAKEKIEILGESLNSGLTIVLGSFAELLLMIYLLALLVQVRASSDGDQAAISDSLFFATMHSVFGRLVTFSMMLAVPCGVAAFALVIEYSPLQAEWSGPRWVLSPAARCTLLGAIVVTAALQLLNTLRILTRIRGKQSLAGADTDAQT